MNLKNSFPKKIRLNNNLIIREVFKQGVYKSLGPFGVKFRKTELESSLFAFSVKKKAGNSPFRNRIKRLLREAVRLERSNLICAIHRLRQFELAAHSFDLPNQSKPVFFLNFFHSAKLSFPHRG